MNKPKKQINRFTLILTSAIFCLVVVQSAPASEPVYDGKPLSQWLVILRRGYSAEEQHAAAPSPEDAIRQMGTNAIPTLLDILGAEEWNKKRIVSKLKSAEFRTVFTKYHPGAEDIRDIAVDGFKVLGTNAEAAVPQLTKLLHEPETCPDAARVLNMVGPKGFSALTNAINDEDLVGVVVLAIGQSSSGDPQVSTRLLISALKSSNPTTRGNTAKFLAGRDASLVVPALIPLLDDSEDYAWRAAAISLGGYGSVAKDAAPKLFSIYTNHPDVFVMGALKGIDMETAAKAESFIVNGGPLGVAGFGWTDTRLSDGQELIAGGFFQTTIPTAINHVFSRAELFDPATGKRTETGSMNVAREYHTATLLPNGKVLVAAGSDFKNNALSSAELYDPTTGKWTVTGSMNSAHPNENAVLQRDGKVRVSGWAGDKRAYDDLYDPTTGTWTVITNK